MKKQERTSHLREFQHICHTKHNSTIIVFQGTWRKRSGELRQQVCLWLDLLRVKSSRAEYQESELREMKIVCKEASAKQGSKQLSKPACMKCELWACAMIGKFLNDWLENMISETTVQKAERDYHAVLLLLLLLLFWMALYWPPSPCPLEISSYSPKTPQGVAQDQWPHGWGVVTVCKTRGFASRCTKFGGSTPPWSAFIRHYVLQVDYQ